MDVANAEEEMNQAMINYSNMCYLLGKQRGLEEARADEEIKDVEVTYDKFLDAISTLANKLGLVK